MLRTLRSADMVTGGLLVALGVVVLRSAVEIKAVVGESLDPHLLPTIVGWVLVVGGVALAFNAWRYTGEAKLVDWPDRSGWVRLGITTGALVVYLLLAEPLGFALSTLVYVAFVCWYLGRYRPWVSILLGVATAAVVQFVFIDFLGLTFPLGPLELLY